MSKLFMKNSGGQPDAMFTVSIVSFLIVSVVVLASMFDSLTLFGYVFDFAEPSVALVSLYLGTCFSSYVLRRNTKDKLQHSKEMAETEGGSEHFSVELDELSDSVAKTNEELEELAYSVHELQEAREMATTETGEAVDLTAFEERQKLEVQKLSQKVAKELDTVSGKVLELEMNLASIATSPVEGSPSGVSSGEFEKLRKDVEGLRKYLKEQKAKNRTPEVH